MNCLSAKTKTPIYKLLFVRTGELKVVSRERFSSLKGKVVCFSDCKIRVIGEYPVSKIREALKAQGITQFLGIDRLFGAMNAVVQLHDAAFKGLDYSKSILARLDKKFTLLLTKLFIECASVVAGKDGLKLDSVISICLSIYSMIDHFEGVLTAQGLDTVMIASILPFLPTQIKDIVKHISLLTHLKILDDFTMIHKLFNLLEEFLKYVCTTLHIPEKYVDMIMRAFSYLGFGSKHLIMQNMEQLMTEAGQNKRIFNNSAYRDKCGKVQLEYDSNAELKEWVKKNGFVADIIKKWELHMKIVRANEEVARVEPNLFVFEGPPACGKSVVLNQVVEILGYSKYVHLIPDINEGKDFYDSYNNEDVFYMDDVGQKGISQWRTIINMVSSVKMPLDCAEAKLKDTKFFNSHTIVATTNNFMHLGGLCKSDGISNTQALWRRGFVFDFGEMSFKNGCFKGTIRFRYYNINNNVFENAYPEYFRLDLEDPSGFLKPYFTIREYTDDLEDLRNWMAAIIKSFELKKRRMQKSNLITPEEKERSKDIVNDLVRKVFFKPEAEEVEDEIKKIPDKFSLWDKSNNFMNYMKRSLQLEEQGVLSENDTYFDVQAQGMDILSACTKAMSTGGIWVGVAIGRFAIACFQSEIDNLINDLSNFDFMSVFTSGVSACKDYLGWILAFVSLALILLVGSYYGLTPKEQDKLEGQGDFSSDASKEHTSVSMMINNVFECNLKIGDVEVGCNCLVSGKLIILPSHLTPEDSLKIKIYRNKTKNIVWLEYCVVELVYRRDEFDLSVFSLPNSFPNPFKNLSAWVGKDAGIKEEIFLISGEGFRKLDTVCDYNKVVKYSFNFGGKVIDRKTQPEYLKYDYQRFGLCGAIVFSTKKGIIGMHVAGDVTQNYGVSSIFSKKVLDDLRALMELDKPLIPLQFQFSTVEKEDTSVIRFYDTGLTSYSPTSSNIVPSALYGIYEVDRFPADLNKYGKDTLKEVSKKSFLPCKTLQEKELQFCEKVLESMLEKFDVLTDEEVIGGTPLLAGLNKDSSNGFGMDKDKTKYIDFINKKITPAFQEILEAITKQSKEGVIDWKHLVWVECLKDEIRNEEKEGVPRSFRIGTLTQQFLMKKYFGKFVEHIMTNRDFNKIMVGCNPIKEWNSMYGSMLTGKVFAGDIKNWDGSMNAEIQQLVGKKLILYSKEGNKNLLSALVSTLTNSLVVVGRDTYLTTHSMPSGSYLTAIMNSIVNKLYTAIWYYRNVQKPTVCDFWDSVDDFVYGDDKLNVVRKHFDTLNAITMKEFFESVGMGFTDSCKKPISEPFQDMEDVTFLKRSFRFHNILARIVCPLELRVIFNTLSYYDCNKDQSTVLKDKINAAQRELYLHPNRDMLLNDLYKRLDRYKVPYIKLSKEYLKSVYLDENYVTPLSFGGEQYA